MRKLLPLLLAAIALLTACASSGKDAADQTASAQVDGLVIRLDELTDEINFVDYMSGDTAMQLIVRKDASGAANLAYNTCQSCSGSPYAYYEVVGSYLVCRNCGNAFTFDEVGKSGFGCHPWPLTDYTAEDGVITLPAETLDSMAAKFVNWKKGL